MKITHFLAAATMIAGLGVSTAASAQDYRHDGQYQQRDDRGYDHRDDRRDERRDDRRDYRHDNGNHYGWDRGRHNGWNNQRRCRTEWRHHRRVTVCYR